MEPFGISYRPGEFQNPKCERCEQEIKTGESWLWTEKQFTKVVSNVEFVIKY
uniref:Uncharacterized protein n=1 Tax=Meloidogyne enterolobii TaxID=390850 RepID=A0A6V7TR54_MELEN|nr:unnamed protein product [Meloidogyne enterolobii]